MKRAVDLAKGMPSDPDKALFWMAEIMAGLQDDREAHFARVRQRLVVFTDRKHATARAKKETKEFWSGKVATGEDRLRRGLAGRRKYSFRCAAGARG